MRARTLAMLLAALVLPGAGPARAIDGETAFKKCLPCHAIGDGAKNKVGPQLNGLAGRAAGTIPGYNYSRANKESGLTWDEATFKAYIQNPRAKIPETKMVFTGIKNAAEIDALWAYIAGFDRDGKPRK